MRTFALVMLVGLCGCPAGLVGRDNDKDVETTKEALEEEFGWWTEDCDPNTVLFAAADCSEEQEDAIWGWLYCLDDEGCGGRALCEEELAEASFDADCRLTDDALYGTK